MFYTSFSICLIFTHLEFWDFFDSESSYIPKFLKLKSRIPGIRMQDIVLTLLIHFYANNPPPFGNYLFYSHIFFVCIKPAKVLTHILLGNYQIFTYYAKIPVPQLEQGFYLPIILKRHIFILFLITQNHRRNRSYRNL